MLSYNLPIGIAYLGAAIIVFCVCLLLDVPRRVVVLLLKRLYEVKSGNE